MKSRIEYSGNVRLFGHSYHKQDYIVVGDKNMYK